MKKAHMGIAMSAMYTVGALVAGAAEVKVDFSTEIGPVKPVNGVGQPPMVEVSGDKGIWAAAAKGEKDAVVMMANDSDVAIPLVCDFQGRTVSVCRITDKDRTDESVTLPTELPPRSFIVAILN